MGMMNRSGESAAAPLVIGKNLKRKVLACGPDLKNTFCLGHGNRIFIGPLNGDLADPSAFESFETGTADLEKSLKIEPEIIAHDLHPGYFSTGYALSRKTPAKKIGVQHHHAHIVSCMADNDVWSPVIGVAFDGTGYGTDGAIWGGEFLIADDGGFVRAAHFAPVPMPGGEAAVRHPWRMAYSYLFMMERSGMKIIPDEFFSGRASEKEMRILRQVMEKDINCPATTSAGRLFDAVSSLVDFREKVEYEGQAAVELQKMCEGEPAAEPYEYLLGRGGGTVVHGRPPAGTAGINDTLVINCFPAIMRIIEEVRGGAEKKKIAAGFHSTLAHIIADVCAGLAGKSGISMVALSGGVFQNGRLLEETAKLLSSRGMEVMTHKRVSCNDSGISLGQAVIADSMAEYQEG